MKCKCGTEMRIRFSRFQLKTNSIWRRMECLNCGNRESIVVGADKETIQKYSAKECKWCGEDIKGMEGNYCSDYCRSTYNNSLKCGLNKEVLPIPYGEHGFDAWVASCWNGSEVRGHAISA